MTPHDWLILAYTFGAIMLAVGGAIAMADGERD